jgi:hypothetical protein
MTHRSISIVVCFLSACSVQIPLALSKACDETHPCAAGRTCVGNQCVAPISQSGGGSNSNPQPGDSGTDAGNEVPLDAGPLDAGTSDGGSSTGLPLGATCASGVVCASGFCSAGVCCNSACTGACESCSIGTCKPRPLSSEAVPACASFLLCDGNTANCPSSCDSQTCAQGLRCGTDFKCVRKTSMLRNDFSIGFAQDFTERVLGSGGTAKIVNGQLVVANSGAAESGLLLQSKETFDFVNSSLTVEVTNGGPQSPNREISFSLFQASRPTEGLSFFYENGKLSTKYFFGGYTEIKTNIDITSSKPLKLRFRASGQNVILEYANNLVWLSAGELPTAFGGSLENVKIELGVACFRTGTCVTGESVFDNLNGP